jgi:hypothetical protein
MGSPANAYNVDEDSKTVIMAEPDVKGAAVTKFVAQLLDRICCFVEELVAYVLSKQLPQFIWLTEIPLHDRKRQLPYRFVLAIRGAVSIEWRLTTTNSPFDET